jgi:hypothetical protein
MRAMVAKEFRQLRRDRRTVAMMIVLPVVLLVVFGHAASGGSRSPSPCPTGPSCWCSTSRRPASARWARRGCGRRSGVPPTAAPGCWSRPTAWKAQECDRLVVMADGRDAKGFGVQAHGRVLRVPGSAAAVRDGLATGGLDAAVQEVPASLEEAFIAIVGGAS